MNKNLRNKSNLNNSIKQLSSKQYLLFYEKENNTSLARGVF